MRRLEINGQFADLSEATIGYTWQYFDILDPVKRFNPYTTTIKLPMTPRNVALIGYGNAVGGRLDTARDIPNVNYYMGPFKIISNGYMKVTNFDTGINVSCLSKTTLQDALEAETMSDVMTQAATTTGDIAANYADTLTSLATGSKGWLLPRTIEDPITSSTWLIHNYSAGDIPQHELWVSAAILCDALEILHSFTFQVAEGGAIVDLQSSDFYTNYLQKIYTPAWNFIFYCYVSPSQYRVRKLTTGIRTINSKAIEYSEMVLFGGKTAWDFIKYIGQATCSIVYFDNGNIVFAPFSEMDTFTEINLTGRIKSPATKYINLPGYEATNFLRYNKSDNLNESYGESKIYADVKPVKTKELVKLDLMLPGRYYNTTEAQTLWNTSYSENTALSSNPLFLFFDGAVTAGNITVNWTGSAGTQSSAAPLPLLRHIRLLTHYISLYVAAAKGIVYECEMNLNLYDLFKFKPYKLIRIDELGGLFYLNKITNFDPYSGKAAKMQIIRMGKVTKPFDIDEAMTRFYNLYNAEYTAAGVALNVVTATDIIELESTVAGVDFTGQTLAPTLADNITGQVVNSVANRIALARQDNIVLTGTSGVATITCNGLSKSISFSSTLAQTANTFVVNNAANYLAVGVILTVNPGTNYALLFTAVVPGTDFTGATTIVNGIPNLSGTASTFQANQTALKRLDYIAFTGDSGLLEITCDGITHLFGYNLDV